MALTQGLQLPFGIQPVNALLVDSYAGPYSSVAEALASIPSALRVQTRFVNIIDGGVGKLYWFKDGIADGNLVEFSTGVGVYVPYTGATQNVNLGEYGVDAGYLKYDTTPTATPTTQGTTYWDADNQTIAAILNGYTMRIGEDVFYPVKNQTGSTITKGTAVRFNGTLGSSGRLLIAPFIANGSVSSTQFMGVAAEDIADGADGKVLWFGRIRGINTNAYNEGDILYASTTVAGGFQTTIPQAPNNIIEVAAVVTKSVNNGVIFVRPSLGSNITKDEGVRITSPVNGQVLKYNSGLWENASVLTLTTTGSSGSSTFNSTTGALNVPTYTLSGLGGEPAIAAGTTSQYWRGDKTWQTLNTAAVAESTNLYFTEARVRNTVLTGLNIAGGTVLATDSILTAFGKVQNQINGLFGGVTYQGTWNASTNTPTLTSSVGTKGHYYIVSVDGSTNLNGITDWKLGDWAIFNGSTWDKVDNTDAVVSVNGFTGAVSLTTANISEVTNLYYTDARARGSLSAGTGISYNSSTGTISSTITQYTDALARASLSAGTGISYNNTTGVITNSAPDQTVTLTAGTNISVTGTYPNFTINNTSTANGTVTSVGLSAPTGFSVSSSPVTSSGTLALGFAAGYSLPTDASQTNWNTAFNKRLASASFSASQLTLTLSDASTVTASVPTFNQNTTGTAGSLSAVLSNTLGGAGSVNGILKANGSGLVSAVVASDITSLISGTYLPFGNVSGTTNFIPIFTGINSIGNSIIFQNGSDGIFINGQAATSKLKLVNPLSGSLFQSGIEFLRASVAAGAKIESLRDATVGGVGLSIYTTANNAAEVAGTYTERVRLANDGTFNLYGSLNGTSAAFSQGVTAGVTSGFSFSANHTTSYTVLNSTISGGSNIAIDNISGNMRFYIGDGYAGSFSTGKRFLLGTTTDNGTDALQVAGSGLFTTNLKIGTATNATQYITISENQIYRTGNGTLFINNSSNGDVDINTNGGTTLIGGAVSNGIDKLIVAGSGLFTGTLKANNAGAQISIGGGGTTAGIFMSNSNNILKIADFATGTKGLDLDVSTGAATFSSTIAASGATFTGAIAGTTATFSGDVSISNGATSFGWSNAGNNVAVNAFDGNMRLYTGTSGFIERMRITSAGNVLIGTTTDNGSKLQVNGGATFTGNVMTSTFFNAGSGVENASINAGHLGFYNASASDKWIKLSDDASTINAVGFRKSGSTSTVWFPSGNVGIGTTSPSARLDVQGGSIINGNGTIQTAITYATGGIIGTLSNHALSIYTNNTERINISASTGAATFSSSVLANTLIADNGTGGGRLTIETSAVRNIIYSNLTGFGAYNQLRFQAGSWAFNNATSDVVTISLSGAITASSSVTATSFFESSDLRQKNVHTTLISKDGINPIQYTFLPDGKQKWGYGAQQVQGILPYAVTEDDKGFLKVDYTTVHTYKIAMLEQEVIELKEELKKYKNGI